MSTMLLDRSFTPLCGDIGEPVRRREYEPMPETEPVHEPSPEPVPAEPVHAPEKEPVPA